MGLQTLRHRFVLSRAFKNAVKGGGVQAFYRREIKKRNRDCGMLKKEHLLRSIIDELSKNLAFY
ncbi:hypothetical protein ACUY4R_004191 [Kosakonia sp. BK9b]